jgi:hypothetical protein
VAIAARDAGCTPNNQVQAVRLTRLDNVVVELAGQAPLTAPTTVALDSHPAQLPLMVRRLVDGQPATLAFVATDGCGEWPSLVGGGPGAF